MRQMRNKVPAPQSAQQRAIEIRRAKWSPGFRFQNAK
jgi:hypothetical protein